jgi:hypothetical protein
MHYDRMSLPEYDENGNGNGSGNSEGGGMRDDVRYGASTTGTIVEERG